MVSFFNKKEGYRANTRGRVVYVTIPNERVAVFTLFNDGCLIRYGDMLSPEPRSAFYYNSPSFFNDIEQYLEKWMEKKGNNYWEMLLVGAKLKDPAFNWIKFDNRYLIWVDGGQFEYILSYPDEFDQRGNFSFSLAPLGELGFHENKFVHFVIAIMNFGIHRGITIEGNIYCAHGPYIQKILDVSYGKNIDKETNNENLSPNTQSGC